jgi:hypothetical protein
MLRRPLIRLTVSLAVLGFVASSTGLGAQDNGSNQDSGNKWSRKYKVPPQSSRIAITIVKDVNGKPIENAAVIFHPIEGDHDKGALELKTNEDGKAIIDVIPIGDTVRLQVIARGFQTYGRDYKVDKAEMSMEVRMKRPGEQYSIYKNNGSSASSGSGSGTDKTAAPPAQDKGDKGSDSGSKSGTPPDAQSNQGGNPPQPK